MSEIRDNLEIVRRRIEEACQRAGRDASEVTLIAVSKTKPVPMLEEAYEGGARDFGENKVQEIQAKYGSLPDDVRWHMIGHLQRNKVHQVLGKAVLIHSVDSLRLARQIEEEADKKEYRSGYSFGNQCGKRREQIWLFYGRCRGGHTGDQHLPSCAYPRIDDNCAIC